MSSLNILFYLTFLMLFTKHYLDGGEKEKTGSRAGEGEEFMTWGKTEKAT